MPSMRARSDFTDGRYILAALGGSPAGTRMMVLSAVTSKHQEQWRLGEVGEYKYNPARGGKKDAHYVKEGQAEKDLQKAAVAKLTD